VTHNNEDAGSGGFFRYLLAWGPGIATVLTWLGAGDIVAGMVAGSEFGYGLLWAMALTVVLRSLLASAMVKYQLVNPHGDSIIDGLSRLGRWLPWLLLVYVPLFVFFTNLAILKACAEVWHQMIPGVPFWTWAFVWAGTAFALVITGNYARVELFLKVILGTMSVAFIYCVSQTDVDLGALGRGVLIPQIPAGLGHRSAFLVLLGIIGGVGGSVATLSYAYFVREKGWHAPRHRRMQLYDITFSAVVMVLLNLCVWILAVEVVGPQGIRVTTAQQMAQTLAATLGRSGEILFYIGLWGAAFSTLVGVTLGSGYLTSDIWHSQLRRGRAGGRGLPYAAVVLLGTIAPLAALLTEADFVTLSLLSNSYSTILIPILIFGTLVITNRTEWIGARYRNSGVLNVVLAAMGVYSLYVLLSWGVELLG
jgi:Mn2+/Fe2+ NRAMP family transporter